MIPSNQTSGASRRRTRRAGLLAAVAAASLLVTAATSSADTATASYASDTAKPDLVANLSGYTNLWQPSGLSNLQGTVKNATTMQRNDQLTSWINQNATKQQQFRALQNSAYTASDGSGYDQSISIADGLGVKLGKIYATGRITGKLPLTTALINSETGTTGAYVSTGTVKVTFSYPRPFLPASSTSTPVAGDDAACAPAAVNGASLTPIRKGKSWANRDGSLRITRVAPVVDRTHQFASTDVTLDAGYGTAGICTGGSFPSGHTTTAYQAGVTLATLLPELAPEILARASEAGNNRIVLGVHYPLDIIGGRMNGEAALAARWSDPAFVKSVIQPARTELVNYLQSQCGAKLIVCIRKDTPYKNNPYGGKAIPGGTSQIVTNRTSAVKVYTERMSYGFATVGSSRLSPSVPAGAASLLSSTFPTLTAKQRASVLAQTESRSGEPLDTTAASRNGTAPGSWQRLNLAAAMSATVQVKPNGTVKVLHVGGSATVIHKR